MAKVNLMDARNNPNDEFYTRFIDIEKEMNAYLEFNPDAFRDKTVLLPCDDPEWSNFTKYFAQKFDTLGLKKLISTSYAPSSRSLFDEPSPFESKSPNFDKTKSLYCGKIFTLSRSKSKKPLDIGDLKWTYLKGDGDFESEEVTALRNEADVIVTNPPFSLFRKFLPWIIEAEKSFAILGNVNAMTYKEVFPLIQQNKIWIGATNFNTGMYFIVPDSFVHAETYKFEKEIDGQKVNRVPAVCWYSNIPHGKRNQPLPLMTMDRNVRYSRHKEIKGIGYKKYSNFDAIEVPFADAIPSDYPGAMGVPITFLDKYNPDQFEIIQFRHGSDGKDLRLEDGTTPYFRVLIRHKKGKR